MTVFERRITYALALLLIAQTVIIVSKYLFEIGYDGRFGGDFICFFEAAIRLEQGKIELIYDADRWARTLAEGDPGVITWFVYPPMALFMVWPLAGLSYDDAVFWWSITPLPFFFTLAFLLARRVERDLDNRGQCNHQGLPFFVLFSATLPFLTANMLSGQTGAFLAVLIMSASYCLHRRPIIAGVFIGLMIIKPQMGILLPFALAAAGHWRTILSASFTVVLLALLTTAWLGLEIWSEYHQMAKVFGSFIGAGYSGIRQLAIGPYVSLLSVGAPKHIAFFTQSAITIYVLVVIVRIYRDARIEHKRSVKSGAEDIRFGMLAAATLLATPYSLTYDTPLLLLAIIPILIRAWRHGWTGREGIAIIAVLMMPFVQPFAINWAIPFGFLAVGHLFYILYMRYTDETSAHKEMRQLLSQ